MKITLKFDGNTDRKALLGYFPVDDKGQPIAKPVMMPTWFRKDGFPDGLPDGFEVELKPIYTNGKKPAAKAAAKPKADKPAAKKKVEKPAEKPTE